MRKLILYIFLLCVFVSCGKPNAQTAVDMPMSSADTASTTSPYEVIDKNVKILATTYLVNVNSSDQDNRTVVMSAPSDNAKKLYEYYLGRKLSVIKYAGDWLGILDSTSYDIDGNKLAKTMYIMTYIKESTTGTLDKFRLKQSDLSLVVPDSGGKLYAQLSDNRFKLELISKEVYDRHRKNAKWFLLEDTLAVRKEGGVLRLPCKDKVLVLKDVNTDDDNRRFHTYKGQIQELNVYVVAIAAYEEWDVVYYDKTTGEEVASFQDNFAISPDLKYIVGLYGSPYDESTYFTFYTIDQSNNNKISYIVSYNFPKWFPFDPSYQDKFVSFFDENDYLYIRIISVDIANWVNENVEDYVQYMRVKIKL